MRTLKKVLALSMVFAMAFSMMAGAAFNDQDQIDASLVEDIQLLTALDVFQGDEKGDFNPTANVTRAQAAKMIYVLKNNGQDDEAAAFKGNSVYSDVPSGHWAEGYINYATNLGIMSGWTEGSVRKFDPNGNVTGLELTKMLLCMIGYRSDVQGYTGSGWQTNVLRDGASSAVTTNYLPTIYNAAPRQWTARLMANAINAPYISYSRGEVVQGSATDPTISYGQQYLGLRMAEGYLKDAGHVELPVLDGKDYTTGDGKVYTHTSKDDDGDEITLITTTTNNNQTVQANKDLTGGVVTFKTTVDPSLLGQHVKVYYKGTNTTTRDYKVYAVLATGRSKVYEATLADVTVGKNKDNAYETIKLDGYNGGNAKSHNASDKIYLVKNLDEVEQLTPNTTIGDTDAGKAKNLAQLNGNSSAPIRLVDQDGNGTIDLAFTVNSNYAIVDSHNAERNTLRLKDADGKVQKLVDGDVVNSESSYKKVNFVNDVAADDVVKVTLDCTTGAKVWNVEKVEPISATATGYTLDKDSQDRDIYATVTINGEATKFAKSMMSGYGKTTANDSHIVNDDTFYTDGKFIVYSKGGDSVASVNNLAYLIASQNYESFGKTTYYVKALLSDGTQGQYEVENLYKAATGSETDKNIATTLHKDSVEGKVMSYTLSDGKISLRPLDNDDTVTFDYGKQSYTHSNKSVSIDGGTSYRVAEEAYFFVRTVRTGEDDKYSVVKASELGRNLTACSSASANNQYATKKVNNIPSIVFGTLVLDTSVVSTAAEYAFVSSAANSALIDGKYYAQVELTMPNGEKQTVQKSFSDNGSAQAQVVAWNGRRGKVVKVEIDTNNEVEKLEKVTKKGALTGNTEGWVKVVVVGWNDNTAYLSTDTSKSGTAHTLNVASDVKVHNVDTSGTYPKVVDNGNSVSTTSKVEAEDGTLGDYVGFSAYVYVQDVNSQLTVTDIFTHEDGAKVESIW